jgi:hypothetical protein
MQIVFSNNIETWNSAIVKWVSVDSRVIDILKNKDLTGVFGISPIFYGEQVFRNTGNSSPDLQAQRAKIL